MDSHSSKTLKVVILGEGRVGKTSLTTKYCLGQFDENEESTINASYLQKEVEVDGQKRTMTIWDTAGQEKFAALAPVYYRDADGAVLVYDITIKQTFEKVHKWIRELREHAGEEITIIIVGNKCDRENDREVDEEESKDWAKKYNAEHFHTSAKSGKGIEEAFQSLATKLFQKKKAKEGRQRLKLQKEKPKADSCC